MANNKKLSIIIEPNKQEIVIIREFNFPHELVWKAFTSSEAIPEWWGPRFLTTTVETMEVKQGGVWRFIQRDPEGNMYAFHGVYHDVTKSNRIISTFEFEGVPGHVVLDFYSFYKNNGVTTVTSHSVFQSVEDRDGMVIEHMEMGIRESYERITEYLEKIK